jgi:hypothetical protein
VSDDSTFDQSPDLGPDYPTYPELPQVVRVDGPPLVGTNVYPAFVQQWSPPLTLRDREPCLVWEPNGIVLGPGFYDCRLVTSYLGLPLYVTTCCVPAASSSSSSSA